MVVDGAELEPSCALLPPLALALTQPPGETDGALRLWLAHEAMRQAEQVLAGQTASLTALETRATTLLTWSATTALALSALALGPTHPVPLGPASIVGALLVATAGACGAALRPDDWHYPGFRLSELAARQHETPEGPAPLLSELEHCEWTAAALEHADHPTAGWEQEVTAPG